MSTRKPAPTNKQDAAPQDEAGAGSRKTTPTDAEARSLSLEHSWNWFTLHANQRLQTVNFFLVAAAFLTAAYVTAIKEQMHEISAVIALVGVLISYYFYRMECRVKAIIKAAEKAMEPIQDELATILSNDAVRIIALVENGGEEQWKYSKVFRFLFTTAGIAFGAGLIYSISLVATQPQLVHKLALQLAIGAFLLGFGRSLVTPSAEADQRTNDISTHWTWAISRCVGAVCILVATALLVYVATTRL